MIIDSALYVDGRRVDAKSPRTEEGFAWVGIVDPTGAELEGLRRDFGLAEAAAEEARHTRQRPRIDVHSDHTFLFVRTARYDTGTERVVMGDVAIFVSGGYVVTVRHGDAIPLKSIRSDLEGRPDELACGPTIVLAETLDRLVDQYVEVAEKLREDVEQIEDVVFDDETPAPSTRLYSVKREVLEFRRAVLPLLEPLTLLATNHVAHVSADFTHRFSRLRENLRRVIDEVEVLSDLMDAALGANLTLVQVKQNADMRKISAWVGIGAVPTMIAGIYGMNFDHMPELGMRYAYFVVLGFLGVVSFALFRLFRRNDWL